MEDPETQQGGEMTTRGIKRGNESKDETIETKVAKSEADEPVEDTTDEYDGGPDPLFVAKVKKPGPAKRWKENAVVSQRFIMTLDQQRVPKPDEGLNIGATLAIAVAVDKQAEENNIPEEYEMTLQIGSREHIKEVLNSGELISADIGFSASVLFKGPETKGGKRSGYIPGEKIWEKLAKELRCVCDIKNKDELCCARVIVVMREYPKREKGASNSFENIRKDRGKNFQQVKEARKLHREANVPEGPYGTEELDKFEEYHGP